MKAAIAAILVAAALTGCSRQNNQTGAPRETPPGVLKIKEIMRDQIEPNAQVYWHSSGTVDTEKGSIDLAPTTEEGWKKAEASVDAVLAGAELLKEPVRARDKGDWMKHADKLIEQARLSKAAVQKRDKDAMFMTGGDLYAVCTGCHQQYLLPYLGPDGRPKQLDANGTPISNPLGK